MAETAASWCPDKTVLLPRLDAGCYMAETITPASLTARKAELPGVPVVAYVNSSAAVKAASDSAAAPPPTPSRWSFPFRPHGADGPG